MSDFVLLVSDPNGPRRHGIMQKCTSFPHVVIHGATTLGDTYRLAESHTPMRVAVAAEIANSREFETLSKMITLIGAELILYGKAGKSSTGHKFIPLEESHDSDRLVTALLAGLKSSHSETALRTTKIPLPTRPKIISQGARIILVGASTGGIPALETMLKEFPANCPPTLVVQHIRSGFVTGLVRRLDQKLAPSVVAATHDMPLENGTVYFAADPGRHLGITFRDVLRTRLISEPAVSGHCPSVDMLFHEAAAFADRVELSAALLTGMGFDGAEGMLELRQAGALTIAQDRETSVVWGMPRVAIEKGAACEILPLPRIGKALLRSTNTQTAPKAKHQT